MVLDPGLSNWNVTDFSMLRSSTESPSPVGEYWSTVRVESVMVICCQPAAPVVSTLPLFDHCWPLVSISFTNSSVAAGALIQKVNVVAPVKSL